jgi:glycyl-tRNA synthetase
VNCGSTDITQAKRFSLMVKSNLGSPTDALSEENVVYLRPETCGGIYLEYKNTLDSTRVKLPFGIAQVGKAFRNEIVARQFVFRTREFEQMEMQYFLHPSMMEEKYDMWRDVRWQWYLELGIAKEDIRWYKHEKLPHYASQAYDIEYNFRSLGGFKEVEGIHARGDWDLSQHSKFSGKTLDYVDEKTKEKFIPHIMETSVGLGRLFLMFLDKAFTVEDLGEGNTRTVLKLPKVLAPIKIAVFPLLKNKPELVAKAHEVHEMLRKQYMCEFDDNGNVGKRYRRQDEIGTPYCVTIDFDTLEKGVVTVRDRDTMEQAIVAVEDLQAFFSKNL